MTLSCRLGWHRWGKWQSVPITSAPSSVGWIAGQIRQCADCYFFEAVKLGDGFAFNYRPLREAITNHIADLRRCVKVFSESEHAEAFKNTSAEMQKAAEELTVALDQDLAVPPPSK